MTDDGSTRWILWSRTRDARSGASQAADRIPLWRVGQDVDAEAEEEPAAARRPPLAAAEEPAALAPDLPAAASGHHRTNPGSRVVSAADQELVWRIVEERTVTIEFQPIRDSSRGQVVGFEALSRGPAGPLRAPDRLFAAAMAAGAVGQLDWICRAAAFRQVLDRDLPPALSLFVNVEPESLIEPCPDDLLETVWEANEQLRVFIDITGRAPGLRASRCVGAAYQSGYLLGRPGQLPARVPVPALPVPLFEVTPPVAGTPLDLLAAHSAHTATAVHEDEIDYLVRVFAVQAANAVQPPVVAVVLPEQPTMPKQSTIFIRMLLGRCPLVLIFGRDVSGFVDWHARTADLPRGHGLLEQLCFVALSPTQSMALAARRSPLHPDATDFTISHNPTACREVLRYLIDTMDTLVGGVRHAMQ